MLKSNKEFFNNELSVEVETEDLIVEVPVE
jgi:hypothetical protein